MALWIAIGAAIICAGIAIYYGTKGKNKFPFVSATNPNLSASSK